MDYFDGKTVLITGGTGSLGQALTKRLLDCNVHSVRVLSRNESKQVEMQSKFSDDRIRFFIGDVRDIHRLIRAFEGADIVFHAAALKHVPIIEYNPFEAIKTNVMGSQNVIDAAIHENVDRVIAVGTDKAVSPLNAYGATKLLMEKLFVSASNYLDKSKYRVKFTALRYGNVLGSSGSVVPLFVSSIKNKTKITVTDPQMTRFSLTMNEALDFILDSASQGKGSEIFVPRLRAYNIMDLKDVLMDLLGEVETEFISIRPGEKLHEVLINQDEIRYTWNLAGKYVLFNVQRTRESIQDTYPSIQKVGFAEYSSDKVEKIPKDELRQILVKSGLLD